MAEEQEIDPVVDVLLRESDLLINDSPLNNAREQFNRDTIILLLGLGLAGEEIQLFQRHEIGLEKLSTLTASDLDYIGITSDKKKRKILDCIRKFNKGQKLNSTQEATSETDFKPEDAQAMDNVLRHQQTLVKIIPYLKRSINTKCENVFFQPGISVNHTFEKVVFCSVQQAYQVHDQLCKYLQELEQEVKCQQKKTNIFHWPSKSRKWCILALLAGSCISLAVWGSRKGGISTYLKTSHLHFHTLTNG
ncbi:hypothetical protein R5R35_007738 [Gryllus longicercus]|uniref:SAM domain-containing protein n=1 Tax=Gryllus longicercus TaxID=2509291 RepID=A0AAN9VL55_9ORTH